MNKPFLIFLFFFFTGAAATVNAQVNLVPNGSFEQYDTCPNMDGRIYYATPWFQPDTCQGNTSTCSSSDYINSCSTNLCMVPNSYFGYQYPRTGNGFAGIAVITNYPDSVGLREYIEVPLSTTLSNGVDYLVEFYVSLANEGNYGLLGTDAIQAVLSDSIVYSTNYQVIHLIPSVSNPSGNIIMDTVNWVRISGTYHAHGGESYLSIGNFLDNLSSSVDSTNGSSDMSYYFIDDVSIYPDSEMLVQPLSDIRSLTVFPNPASNKLNVQLYSDQDCDMKFVISDILGQVISEENFSAVQGNNIKEFSLQEFPVGTYFIQVESESSLSLIKFVKE